MTIPLADNYFFWTPEDDKTVSVGPDQEQVPLPQVPLPIKSELCEAGDPTDDAIGTSIYDYLRQFPECPHNRQYAEILRDVYPHFLADLGSQIVMLDHKDVEAPYVKRKIVSMQILLLLNPGNPGLLLQLGINFYELGLMFPELPSCRAHFTRAIQYLSAVDNDVSALNYLARIDYLTGDFPKAIERWEQVKEAVGDAETKAAINDQIESLRETGEPEKPLLEDLEWIGTAMQLMAENDVEQAKLILEKLEQENVVPIQFPNPEFYYMLGICRERTGDLAGAFESFDKALVIEPDHVPSQEGKDRVSGGL
jgi:tetratricopeptide (TPR) repeat protein